MFIRKRGRLSEGTAGKKEEGRSPMYGVCVCPSNCAICLLVYVCDCDCVRNYVPMQWHESPNVNV